MLDIEAKELKINDKLKNDKFKSNKLELEIIIINLSNIGSPDGTELYKYLY